VYLYNRIYKTTPHIIHAPALMHFSKKRLIGHDLLNPYWAYIIKNWEKDTIAKCKKEIKKELTIITWNNMDVKGFCEKSMDKLSLNYIVLGKKFKDWRNINKITTALEIINTIKTPYIMGLDGFDTIVLCDPHEALEKFKGMDCEMLFNAEKNYYPDYGIKITGRHSITDVWRQFEKNMAKSEWQFLNAGAFIAKTSFYKMFLVEFMKRHDQLKNNQESLLPPPDLKYKNNPDFNIINDDQVITHWLFYDYYPRLRIDYHMNIFFNTIYTCYDEDKIAIKESKMTAAEHIQYILRAKVMSYFLRIYLFYSKVLNE